MFHANLVLLILIGVLCSTITSFSKKDLLCGRDEVWRLCAKCQRTCGNSPGIIYSHCSETCIDGCQCKRRYVRGPQGDCIDPSECHIIKYLDNILNMAR